MNTKLTYTGIIIVLYYDRDMTRPVLMSFTRPVLLVRANLVFVGIRYKHLGYKASKATTILQSRNSLRSADPVAVRRRHGALALTVLMYIQFPIPDMYCSDASEFVY